MASNHMSGRNSWGFRDFAPSTKVSKLPSSNPAEEFRKFRKLPIELQHKIFEEYGEQDKGRIVEIRWSKTNKRFYVDTPIPPLLHVCRDSRKITLKFYEIMSVPISVTNVDTLTALFAKLGMPLPDPSVPPPPTVCLFRMYFKYDRDTLYFSSFHCESGEYNDQIQGVATKLKEFLYALNAQRAVAEKIRLLAFDTLWYTTEVFGAGMYNMVNLEHLYFVFDDGCCASERISHGRGRPHKQAMTIEKITIPELPVIKPPPPTNHIAHIPGLGFQQIGLPISSFPGFPLFNAQPAFVAALSEDEQRAIKVGEMWEVMDEKLITYLDANVADHMGHTSGRAREDWSDLVTNPGRLLRASIRQKR